MPVLPVPIQSRPSSSSARAFTSTSSMPFSLGSSRHCPVPVASTLTFEAAEWALYSHKFLRLSIITRLSRL